MSSGYSSPEQSFARKKKRYHDSEDDYGFDASTSNKKRRLQESLERENLLKAKTPSRAVTHWANPLQERENDRFSLRKPVIKNDPSKVRDYDTSTASLASNCRIRTELLQDTNCSNNSKSLSLPRNQISQQVLKTGNTDNTGSEGVQRDNGVGGDHTDCTASRAITKDDRFENKALSDHIGDIKSQCSQNNRCQNFELLSENKDEASIIHVPPLYYSITTINPINQQLDEEVPCHSIFGSPSQMRHSRRAVAITQQNGHLSLPTIEKRSRVSKAPRSLLRKVLSRPRASIPLDKFRYLEDEIEFVDIIGETTEEQHHARIFRIAAGGRDYALKVVSIRNSIRVLSPLLTPLLYSTSTRRKISPSTIHNSLFPIDASTANQLPMRAPRIFKIYLHLRFPNATDTWTSQRYHKPVLATNEIPFVPLDMLLLRTWTF